MLLALLAVALLEASNAATGVENLLLAGVERMALRAHIHRHMVALGGRTRLERVTARTRDGHLVIIRMNTLLHNIVS